MGLLVVLKRWPARPELWLRRQLEALRPWTTAVVAPGVDFKTRKGLRVVDLDRRLWTRSHSRVQGPLALSEQGALQHKRNRALRRLVSRRDVDAVIVHYLDWALKFEDVWSQVDRPLFVHCHGYDITWDLRYPHVKIGQPRHPEGYVEAVQRLARRAILIANSEHSAGRLRAIGVPEDRIRVKPMGVPVPDAPPSKDPRRTGLEYLFVGRLVDCKGPDLTVQAFSRACAKGLDAHLVVAGDGWLRIPCELARARSPASDRIRLVGSVHRRALADLWAAAHVFTAHSCRGVLTRQEESFGVSFVEAMAQALPVVTGRSGGLPDLITDGVDGVLFDPGDLDAHAETLLRLGRDPAERQRLGEAAWATARERYSLERERERFLEILGIDAVGPLAPPKCLG